MSAEQAGSGPAWAPGYAYLSDTPPLEFAARVEHEDFSVVELPLREPEGAGTHVWFELEKRGVSTDAALRRIAKHLGVAPRSVGWAGRKDARAVTRQWLSVEHVEPERVRALQLPGLRVLAVERAERKLKVGQLAGNRFEIRLRAMHPPGQAGLSACERTLAELERRGVPNYFGAQRFGWNGRAFELGAALVQRDYLGYVTRLCSADHGLRPATVAGQARDLRDREALSRLEQALRGPGAGAGALERTLIEACIRALGPELAGCVRAIGRGERDGGVLAARVPRRLARLHVAAFASRIFNDVLAARVESSDAGPDCVVPGDVAFLHAGGAAFVVPGAAKLERGALDELRARAARFELSPSGPMGGSRLLTGSAAPAEFEARAFAAHGVAAGDFGRIGLGLDQRGTRRPLRVRLEDLSMIEVEGGVQLGFRLPAGVFATTVLEELAKTWGLRTGSRGCAPADDREPDGVRATQYGSEPRNPPAGG